MEIFVGQNSLGLDVYRELDYFIGGIRDQKIDIFYYEWMKSPNGMKIESSVQHKKYILADLPAVTTPGELVLITPEVGHTVSQTLYAEDGITIIEGPTDVYVVDTPALYERGPDVIVTPASTPYTNWKNKLITPQMVGARLGTDIIIGAINSTLQSLPVDVENNHILRV